MDLNTVENFNETKLKKCLINFEKKFNENQKLRIKHAEEPTKFAISETELFAALDELQGIATQPELFPVLIEKKAISTLLTLINHENTDISMKVIGMIEEFTELEEDTENYVENLIETMLDGNVIDLIVSNLSRLRIVDADEVQAIKDSLGIIDNLIDYDSKLATKSSKLLIEWIIQHIKKSAEFDPLKLSMAEILSILLINSDENKAHLGQAGGIDVLLQQVAYYRRVAPITSDEHEFLEQTINCLCTAVLGFDKNRESFFHEEGVDLIELILREKRDTIRKSNIKMSILKLFNHVLTTDKTDDPIVTQCSERFIEVLGLRLLFPLFNNPKLVLNDKVKKKEYHQFLDEVEEHTSAILLALLKYCRDTDHIQRILIKLSESDFEKFNRALQLHDKYFKIIQNQEDQDVIETKSSSYYVLRTIDYIILLTCYLSQQFETYDPTSGETFTNYFRKILSKKPQLRHQIVMETRRHIDEVSDSLEEKNSLNLLLEHFEKLCKESSSKH